MKNKYSARTVAPVVIALFVATSGCAGVKHRDWDERIRVTSDPPEAVVYASGVERGSTPLYLPADAFPVRRTWFFFFGPVGNLTLKKPGCETYSIEVDAKLLSDDIHLPLKCGSQYYKETAVPEQSRKRRSTVTTAGGAIDPTERHLKRLNSLHDKGLITDVEYRDMRQRILDKFLAPEGAR